MSSNELLDYLQRVKFDKQIKKLTKKLKDKTVVIYGTGLLFQEVLKNYDLSGLNIIVFLTENTFCKMKEIQNSVIRLFHYIKLKITTRTSSWLQHSNIFQ